MQMTLQEFEQRTCQEPTAGALDSHAKISALQENSKVSQDSVLACFFTVTGLIRGQEEKDRPS